MAQEGFFSTLEKDLSTGIGTVFTEILPVWTAQQLKTQQTSALFNPTFDAKNAPARVDGAFFEAGFLENTEAVGQTAILIGIAIVAVIIIVKV